MTLIMTMIRPEGIWQSADNRVTLSGQPIDDERPKQLHVICPPLPGGPQLLLAFTGLAEMPDGTPTIQWARETLRGEQRFIMPMLEHLRDRLSRDVGQSHLWNNLLVFSGGIFDGGKRFYVEIRNGDPKTRMPKREFDLAVCEVTEPMVFIAGSGEQAVSREDRALLLAQSRIRPAEWGNHLGLLAAVNRRTANALAKRGQESVSPWCSASYISQDEEGSHSKNFSNPGEPKGPQYIESLLAGIDLHDLSKPLIQFMNDNSRTDIDQISSDEATQNAFKGRP
jgi:hypothetical protein